MFPAWLQTAITLIKSAIKYAPQVEGAVVAAKNFIAALFAGKVIDAATQDALMKHVDAFLVAVASDTPPPAWTVEADPPAPAAAPAPVVVPPPAAA